MSVHSPEPWAVSKQFPGYVCRFDGTRWVQIAYVGSPQSPCADDARRIVACVNACEGVPTETLEAGGLPRAMSALYNEYCDRRV
jgi:hypothetical protein